MSAYLNIRIPEWLDKICVCPLLLYRRLKYGQQFRKISLGDDAYTIVDPDVYYEKCQYNWYLTGNGKKAYPAREKIIGPQKTRRSYLHREIVKPRKGILVDHRDSDPLNNLNSNLRRASYSQNMINRPKRPNTSSKFRGVSWSKYWQKLVVEIRWQEKGRPKRKQIGYFDRAQEVDAARSYDCAALKYHGEFARLNFPREDYVKVGNHYEYAGTPPAECSGTPADLFIKICSLLLTQFGKHKKKKGKCL